MTKIILSIIVVCALNPAVKAQSLETPVSIISSLGGSAILDELALSFTLGETVIATDNNDYKLITQGFHQPCYCPELSTSLESEDFSLEVLLYPNPASHQVIIRFRSVESLHKHHFEIIDQDGRRVNFMEIEISEDQVTIPLHFAASGVHYLHVLNSNFVPIAIKPFVIAR